MLKDAAKNLDIPITPEDLEFLQGVFDEMCKAKGYAHGSDAAAGSARLMISLFQSGIRNRRQLMSMMTGRSFP